MYIFITVVRIIGFIVFHSYTVVRYILAFIATVLLLLSLFGSLLGA